MTLLPVVAPVGHVVTSPHLIVLAPSNATGAQLAMAQMQSSKKK